jgi:hypothetical protein
MQCDSTCVYDLGSIASLVLSRRGQKFGIMRESAIHKVMHGPGSFYQTKRAHDDKESSAESAQVR